MDDGAPGHPGRGLGEWTWTGIATSSVVVWIAWTAATLGMILFVRTYDHNIPWRDDFALVSVMTRHERVSLSWAATQWCEHRPVVSRLILAALLRSIPDFRAGMILNVTVISAAAASSLLLVRHLRGHTSVLDGILPLSVLNVCQTECLQIAFALNLVMTAAISWMLIHVVCRATRSADWRTSLRMGLLLVLLPLCGGSGLVMLPPLALWLAGYLAFGWWSGRATGRLARFLGLALLSMTIATVGWYLTGFSRGSLPVAPSMQAVGSTMLDVLSLVLSPSEWGVLYPQQRGYWQWAGLSVAILIGITLLRLAIVARDTPEERPRALGLIAVFLSLLCVVAAVGVARSGYGPGTGLADRYFTLSVPLLGLVYVAWLLYGPAPIRRGIQIGLLTIVCAGMPFHIQYARTRGNLHREILSKIEQDLRGGVTSSRLLAESGSYLFPDREWVSRSLTMLKSARIGEFRNLVDDRVAVREGSRTRIK